MKIKSILKILGFSSMALATACTDDKPAVDLNTGECPLRFELNISGYENSRSGEGWKDGDCVYLLFHNGSSSVSGHAVYDAAQEYWTLYYNGQISNGTSSVCDAYYFENATATSTAVTLTTESCIYSDAKGQYTKTSEGITIKASLTPMAGRLRIKGSSKSEFLLSGVKTYLSYDIEVGTFSTTKSGISLTIGEDGYSPYIHALFEDTDRKLTIGYPGYVFSRVFDHPVLDAGETGYIDLPTDAMHNGWDMTRITEPTVSSTTVSDIGVSKASLKASLTSDGNGTISDCGFCYSTSATPTVADAKVSYGVASGSFGTTISDLQENTTYYVRAYAINESGIGYGEITSFTTLEVVAPTVSAVTMSKVMNKSAEAAATVTSVGNGTLSEAGFVYDTTSFPTTSSGKKYSCGKTTSLKAELSGLTPQTTYYIRAYAINEKGTSYGEETTFTTAKAQVNSPTTITVETSFGYAMFDIVKIEGGTFNMGAQSKSSSQANYDADAYSDEEPVHSVTLSSFSIGVTEVSQKLWYVVMGSYPSVSSTNGLGDDYPVYNISYDQAKQFITNLNSATGQTFRLPTEAEWEFAARGGNASDGYKYSGSNTVGSVGWYNGNASGKAHESATKTANELNLYDMTGNVWEWCSDWYGSYSLSSVTNPTGPSSGSARVIRGGGNSDNAVDCRITVRSSATPSTKSTTIGFRLAMD